MLYPSSGRRRGLSEIVSSLAVLGVTVALLGVVGYLALGSVRTSGSLLSSGAQGDAKESGLLLALVSVQTNSTGDYAWVFNYGWVPGTASAAYLNGGLVNLSSTCGGLLEPGGMCAFSTPAGEHGEVSLVFGAKSLDYSV
jgi:hypothetical protein